MTSPSLDTTPDPFAQLLETVSRVLSNDILDGLAKNPIMKVAQSPVQRLSIIAALSL